MCGSLRILARDRMKMLPDKRAQQEWSVPGGKFRITVETGKSGVAQWDGHAREESLKNTWYSKGWKRCDIHVDGYTEGYVKNQYNVPKSYVIAGIAKKVGNVVLFRVITRDARGAETKVHDRFPKMIKQRY